MNKLHADNRRLAALLPLLLLLGLLAACTAGTSDSPPVATLQPQPATPIVAAGSNDPGAGRTADGTYYLGNPDAPVTLTDHSDFL